MDPFVDYLWVMGCGILLNASGYEEGSENGIKVFLEIYKEKQVISRGTGLVKKFANYGKNIGIKNGWVVFGKYYGEY